MKNTDKCLAEIYAEIRKRTPDGVEAILANFQKYLITKRLQTYTQNQASTMVQ